VRPAAFAAGFLAGVAGTLGAALGVDRLRRYNLREVGAAEGRHPAAGEYVTVDGVRLHMVQHGSGRPVLLLHGAAGTLHDFDAVVRPLGERGFRAIALDRPGHGFSQAIPHSASSAHAQARLLRSLVRQLGLDRPIVVGYSWSGALALACAELWPDEMGAAVLVGGTTHQGEPPRNLLYWLLRTPVADEALLGLGLVPIGRPYIAIPLARAFHPQPLDMTYLRRARDVWVRPTAVRAMMEDFSTLAETLRRLRPLYPRLRVPTVVLTGDRDRLVQHRRNSLRFAAQAPAAELVVLPGVGHAIPQTRPDALIQAVERAATLSAS